MSIRAEVCTLNEHWDNLYQQLKLKEQSSQNILALWYNYKDKMRQMHSTLDNFEAQIELQKNKNEEELSERIQHYQVSSI